MKKTNLIPILFIVFFVSLLICCRKENRIENVQFFSRNVALIGGSQQQISDWIEKCKAGLSINKANNINLIQQNLDFSDASNEARNNGDNLIIVPVSNQMLTKKNLNKNYRLNLLVVKDKTGKIKWGTIVCFLPAGGTKSATPISVTLRNIINNEPITDNGVFKFLSLTGRLLYQLEYRNNKLYSWSRIQTKVDTNANIKSSTRRFNTTARMGNGCTDWYLITTYYYSDGSSDQTWDYIGTTCDGCDDPNYMSLCPDGGGGGSGAPDSNDQEITTSVTLSGSATDYTDDDLAMPSGAVTGAASYTPIHYNYPVEITSGMETGIVVSVTMGDAFCYPVNETYLNPNGLNVTRNLLMTTYSKTWAPLQPHQIECSWQASVLARYTYLPSRTTTTRTLNADYTSAISF